MDGERQTVRGAGLTAESQAQKAGPGTGPDPALHQILTNAITNAYRTSDSISARPMIIGTKIFCWAVGFRAMPSRAPAAVLPWPSEPPKAASPIANAAPKDL